MHLYYYLIYFDLSIYVHVSHVLSHMAFQDFFRSAVCRRPPTVYNVVKDEEYKGEIKVGFIFTPEVFHMFYCSSKASWKLYTKCCVLVHHHRNLKSILFLLQKLVSICMFKHRPVYMQDRSCFPKKNVSGSYSMSLFI